MKKVNKNDNIQIDDTNIGPNINNNGYKHFYRAINQYVP